MNDIVRSAYRESRRVHEHLYKRLMELRNRYTKQPGTIEDVTDSIYALKETQKAIEDIAKETRKMVSTLERLCCIMWVAKGDMEPIRTEMCTGSPDQKQTVITPRQGTPEYEEFRKYFGVPEGVPFRPHWPSMIEKITADRIAGKPLPPGCDPSKMMTEYRVTIRNKKTIEGGEVSDPDLLKHLYDLVEQVKSQPGYIALDLMQQKRREDENSVESSALSDTDDDMF